MKNENLDIFELPLLPHHLTKESGSDGLHLGADSKRDLFDQAINKAIGMHRTGPPTLKHVGLPLQPEVREAMNMARRQKRKMRRTRAAERQLFEAAAAENNNYIKQAKISQNAEY